MASYSSASRYRAGNGALFTSSKCPPTQDHVDSGATVDPGMTLSSTCELPFGFLYTPMAATEDDQEESHTQVPCIGEGLPPVLCLTCLAYLNLYATFDDKQPGIWYCALCGSKNAAPSQLLQLQQQQPRSSNTINPVLVSPQLEFRQPLPSLVRHPNPPTTKNKIKVPIHLILVVDANLPKEEAHEIPRVLRRALQQTRDNHDSTMEYHLGFIVFDQFVSIYQLGLSGMACADVFSSTEDGLTLEHLQNRQYLTPHEPRSSDNHDESSSSSAALDRLTMCISAVFGVVEEGDKENRQLLSSSSMDGDAIMAAATPPKPLSRLEMLKQRKAERLKKQAAQQQQQQHSVESPSQGTASQQQQQEQPHISSKLSPWMQARQPETAVAHRHAYRATGEALHTALNLTTASAVPGQKAAPTSRLLLFTNGCPNWGDGSVVDRPTTTTSHHNHHGGGPDVVHPLKMARAIEYFDTLARSAPGVAIDVFCTGSSELAIAAYQACVEPSGGYVLPHDSFCRSDGADQSPLEHNVSFLLQHTHVSSVQHAALFGGDPDNSNNNDSSNLLWDGCIVDIRASPFLTPTHLVGPGELMAHDNGVRRKKKSNANSNANNSVVLPNERSAFALGSSLAAQQYQIPTHHLPSHEFVSTTLTRLAVGRVDPLSTYSVMFHVNDAVSQKTTESTAHAFFQCIARFVSKDGTTLVTRVSTHRLAIAKDVSEFLDSVDDEVIPVVLGKEAVYRSMHGRELKESDALDAPSPVQLESLAFRAQEDLDNTIARISGSYRLLGLQQGSLRGAGTGVDLTEEGGVSAAGSSVDFAFPPELSQALRRLYYLRRGPLLNPGPMRSLDDRAEIRSLFIRFPMEDCLCMMAPLLWRCGPNEPDLEEIPPETLALWGNSVIAADNYHTMIVWSGNDVADESNDELRILCKAHLVARAEYRFPMPQLHIVAEKESMSRRFTALLAPSHGDPIDHSLANFPALARLSSQQLEAVRVKFTFYDPESDPSFRSWFWNVASATSTSKDEGISLCE